MSKVSCVMRKIVLSSIILYLYNYLSIDFLPVVPINIITILLLALCNAFGFIGLVVFYVFL